MGERLSISLLTELESPWLFFYKHLAATRLLPSSAKRIDLLSELFDVRLFDRQRRDEYLFARRNAGAIALENLGHQLHRLIPKLEWLLHHGRINGVIPNAVEGFIFFVKGDDFHLAKLACVAHRAENGRAFIGPESDQSGDVRLIHERVRGVGFCADAIGIVGAHIDDLHIRALKHLFYAL